MKAGKYRVTFSKTQRLEGINMVIIEFNIEGESGTYNYAHLTHRVGKGWRAHVGWKPSVTNHKLIGEYDSATNAFNALTGYLRIRSYEPGTREYVEAYRDRWLPEVEIIDEIPDGWRVNDGATTAPVGAKWVATGSMFWKANGLKRYEHKLLYVGR